MMKRSSNANNYPYFMINLREPLTAYLPFNMFVSEPQSPESPVPYVAAVEPVISSKYAHAPFRYRI